MATDASRTGSTLTVNQEIPSNETSRSEKVVSGNNPVSIGLNGSLKPVTNTTPAPDSKNGTPGCEQLTTDTEIVQRKWQMVSCVHFFDVFRDVLPLRDISVDTAEDLTPQILEQAIVQPEQSIPACFALRDIIMSLLVALNESTLKNVSKSWFQSLSAFVSSRPMMFLECFDGEQSLLKLFDDGLIFLVSVTWNVRLGLLLALCDIVAEESTVVRQAIRDAEQTKPQAQQPQESSQQESHSDASPHAYDSRFITTELEPRGIRLMPIGRCSRKRTFYMIGKTRIYSGYKRKGTGTLHIECSDSTSMVQLAASLESSQHPQDVQLAALIRAKFLQPLLKYEEEMKLKIERKLREKIQEKESRSRNLKRLSRKLVLQT